MYVLIHFSEFISVFKFCPKTDFHYTTILAGCRVVSGWLVGWLACLLAGWLAAGSPGSAITWSGEGNRAVQGPVNQ